MNPDHPQRRPFFTATYLFATLQRASGLASDAPVTHEAESAAPRPRSRSYSLLKRNRIRMAARFRCVPPIILARSPCTKGRSVELGRGREVLTFLAAEGSNGGLKRHTYTGAAHSL